MSMRKLTAALCAIGLIVLVAVAFRSSATCYAAFEHLDGIWVGACPDCTVTGSAIADPNHPKACALAQQGCSCANCIMWTLGGCNQQNAQCSATGGPNFTCHTRQTVCPGSEMYKLCTDLCIGEYMICTSLFSTERQWMCSKQGSYTEAVQCTPVPSGR
jgi:hypothetical protein